MARTIVQSLPERSRAQLQNVTFDLENRLFLTPDNLLAQAGDPRRLDVGLPGFTDGINLYAGFSIQEMIRQTDTPLAFRRSSYYLAEFDEDGHPAPDTAGGGDEKTPARPELRDVAASSGGYQPGVTRIAFCGVDRAGRWTRLSPYVSVTILAGEVGHNISIPFPSIPGDWAGLAVFMTDPDGEATYWYQRTIDLASGRPISIEMQGPLRRDRKHPGTNATFEGITTKPTLKGNTGPNSLLPGEYAIWAIDVTPSGLALPSAPVTYTLTSTLARRALYVIHGSKAPGGIGWMCFVRQKDGRTYVVYPADSNPEQPLPYGKYPAVTSYDPQTWPVDSQGNPSGWAVAQRDLPAVDDSGLDDPIDPFDQPSKYGGTGVHSETTARRLFVALTATVGGVEGPRGPAANILINAGRAVRVIIPKTVQKLKNAKQSETGSDGFPLDVTYITPTTGGSIRAEPGQSRVTVNQSANGATPAIATSLVAVNRAEDYRIHGELEVVGYTNSNGLEAVLQEFAADASTLVRSTPLELPSGFFSMSGVGVEEYDRLIRSADNFWTATTAFARVVHQTPAGANARNLSWIVRNTDFLEQEHLPEKAKKGDRERNEPDDPEAAAEEDTPEGPDYSPRKPKRKPHPQVGRGKPEPDRPWIHGRTIKTYGFEAGENRSALTLTRTPADSFRVAEIIAAAAIEGSLGFHVRDSGTAGNAGAALAQVFYSESFAAPRKDLGIRPAMRIVALPPSGTWVEVLQLTNLGGDSRLGSVYVENAGGIGRLGVRVFDSASQTVPVFEKIISTGAVAGDVFEFEPVLQGGGTDDGHARFWIRKNGGNYQHVADYDGVDWSNLELQRYQFGICSQSAAAATIDLHFDSVQVTERGRSHFRERDEHGRVIYQGHWSYPKGHRVVQGVLPRTLRLAAKPETTYVAGIFLRHAGLKGVQRPFYITLHKLDGSTVHVGSLLGSEGATGTAPWRDYVVTYTTPPDCYEMRIQGHDIGPGKYAFQELCISEGAMTDAPFTVDTATNRLISDNHGLFSGQLVRVRTSQGGSLPAPLDRHIYYWTRDASAHSLQLATEPGGDAVDLTTPGSGTQLLIRTQPKRTGRRAVDGSFRQTLDTRTPREAARGPHLRRSWRRGGVIIEEEPPGTSVVEVFSSSPNLVTYRGPYANFADVPRQTYLEDFVTLTGDGIETPVIANESPFLEFELSDATLLREDGTEFDGGAVVLDLQSPAYIPPVEVRERLDRKIVRHVLAADVGEVAGFKVQVFTEAAYEEIMNTWMKRLFRVEGRGRSIVIKPGEQISLTQVPKTQQRVDLPGGERYYYVYATGEAGRCELVEESRL